MRKLILSAVALTALTLTSCRGYEREQDRLDRESEGKGELLKAESTKKVKIEQAKADLESAKLDAQTKLTKVEAESKAKILRAEADSKARLLNAESQAKANEMLDRSITPMILEYNKINKWNGKLPTTVAGSSGTLINIK